MEKKLFLTGPSGCGKTTLIRSALGDKIAFAGGFITERRSGESGLYYVLRPSAAAAGELGYGEYRFLDYTVSPPKKDNEVFRNQGAELLRQTEFYPFNVIDEFGGYEILIPQFREALLDFLNLELPCIGVLKGEASAEELRRRFSLGDKLSAYVGALRSALERDSSTRIVEMRGFDDKNAINAVNEWVREYVNV